MFASFTSIVAQTMPPAPAAPNDQRMLALLMSLLLAMVVLPLVGIWLGRLGARWFLAGDGEPRCGACGYSVRGLNALNCPECGADLRGVGIVRRDPAGLAWTLTAWTAFITILGMIAIGAVLGAYEVFASNTALRDHAWAPSSVLAGYVAAWVVGCLIILRFRRRPLAWAPTTESTSSAESAAATEPVSRVLTIMFVDMQGYTARAGGSSRDGLITLIRQVRELVKPVAAARGGRVVKTMGDGFLITFESPTDAVLAGRDIQAVMARENTKPSGGPVELRIGVSTGEVALEADDVYGEPVNMAARIQQHAKAGEVYFSESTWHAMTRSEVPHEPAGEFALKGIDEKARVFRAV